MEHQLREENDGEVADLTVNSCERSLPTSDLERLERCQVIAYCLHQNILTQNDSSFDEDSFVTELVGYATAREIKKSCKKGTEYILDVTANYMMTKLHKDDNDMLLHINKCLRAVDLSGLTIQQYKHLHPYDQPTVGNSELFQDTEKAFTSSKEFRKKVYDKIAVHCAYNSRLLMHFLVTPAQVCAIQRDHSDSVTSRLKASFDLWELHTRSELQTWARLKSLLLFINKNHEHPVIKNIESLSLTDEHLSIIKGEKSFEILQYHQVAKMGIQPGNYQLFLSDGRNIYVTANSNHGLFAEYRGEHTNKSDARRTFTITKVDGQYELGLQDGRNVYVTGNSSHALFAEPKGSHTNNDDARRRFLISKQANGRFEVYLADGRNVYVTRNSDHDLFAEYKGSHTNTMNESGAHRREFTFKSV